LVLVIFISISELDDFWTSGVELNGRWHWEQSNPSLHLPIKYFEWCKGRPYSYGGQDLAYILVSRRSDGVICWENDAEEATHPAICQPYASANNLMENIIKLSSQLTGCNFLRVHHESFF